MEYLIHSSGSATPLIHGRRHPRRYIKQDSFALLTVLNPSHCFCQSSSVCHRAQPDYDISTILNMGALTLCTAVLEVGKTTEPGIINASLST